MCGPWNHLFLLNPVFSPSPPVLSCLKHILLSLNITEKLATISKCVEKFLLVQKCNPLLGLRSFFVNVRPGQLILDCFVFSNQSCLVWNLDGILRL